MLTNQMHTICYKYDNIIIYTNSYMFQVSLAHHQEMHSYVQQSLDLVIISNMWNCCKFFNVLLIEMDMCTVSGAACRFKCVQHPVGLSVFLVHTSISINHTWMNFRQFRILKTIIRSNNCFIQLCTPL
jgi:hypothetical protein